MGERDEKVRRVPIGPVADVDILLDALYESKKFALVPGTIDCLLVRDEDGSAKVWLCFLLLRTLQELSNRDVVDSSQQYEVRLKPVATGNCPLCSL